MSKIRWIKHITMSNTLLCPAIDSVKHITVSTLAFNTLIQPSPFYMLWSYHASLCLDLYYYKRGEGRGRGRGDHRMVVGFITTYPISAYHH